MNSPDKYCDTRADGECVSEDPRCMHQPPERDVYHEYKDDSNDPELARMQRDAYLYAIKALTGTETHIEKGTRIHEALSEVRPPDLDFCSRCHEHTDFEKDEDEEGEWLSICCSARPVTMGDD